MSRNIFRIEIRRNILFIRKIRIWNGCHLKCVRTGIQGSFKMSMILHGFMGLHEVVSDRWSQWVRRSLLLLNCHKYNRPVNDYRIKSGITLSIDTLSRSLLFPVQNKYKGALGCNRQWELSVFKHLTEIFHWLCSMTKLLTLWVNLSICSLIMTWIVLLQTWCKSWNVPWWKQWLKGS